jgi:hypothetical protein
MAALRSRTFRSTPGAVGRAGELEMNLLVKALGESWRAIRLLPVVVTLSACAVTTPVPIAPTATSSLEMRPLSASEKATLGKTLSQTLKDPGASQFKWLPVAANGSGAIGYCGLVNLKGSDGRYLGFRRFFAMISKGPKGDYSTGRLEHIDGIPVTSGSGSEDDAVETGLTEDNCKEWGYTDFGAAN